MLTTKPDAQKEMFSAHQQADSEKFRDFPGPGPFFGEKKSHIQHLAAMEGYLGGVRSRQAAVNTGCKQSPLFSNGSSARGM